MLSEWVDFNLALGSANQGEMEVSHSVFYSSLWDFLGGGALIPTIAT